MYDLYLASGVTILVAGVLTGSYLIYSLYKAFSAKKLKRTIAVSLSETLVSIAIGAFYIYSYSSINKQSALRAALVQDEQQNNTNIMPLSQSNSTNIFCKCEEFWMQQAMFVIALAHSFITLLTTGIECQRCIKEEINTNKISKTIESQKSEEQTTKHCESSKRIKFKSRIAKREIGIIFLQWIIPLLTIVLMCLSTDAFKKADEIEEVNEIQTLITDVMENQMNISTSLKYKQDVDNIVSRVYSIIEEVANNQSIDYTGPKPEDLYNIIEMLDIRREPKMVAMNDVTTEYDANYKFKLYTFFFTIFDYLLPLVYSNIIYIKSKMCLKLNQDKVLHKRGTHELPTNMKHLRNSIILATILWTPSFIEFISRTFLTNEEPNTITQALMATGNSYILLRYGIHVKTIKDIINQSNNVLPLK